MYIRNRRETLRVNQQFSIRYQHGDQEEAGLSINLSEHGARVFLRHPVAGPFRLTLQLDRPVRVQAYPVWEQPLRGGGRIMGVRLRAAGEERRLIKSWLEARASE